MFPVQVAPTAWNVPIVKIVRDVKTVPVVENAKIATDAQHAHHVIIVQNV
tara:strand:- start:1365 stop:1514 length:150 start_codon:yes stop_codon:yes gene_type:complete